MIKRSNQMDNKIRYSLTNYKKETSINYNEAEKIAYIYTCRESLIRKLDKLCKEYPEHFKMTNKDEHSKTYEISKKYVSIRTPRILSEKQIEQCKKLGELRRNKPRG
jgi:uncharacterized protein (DUF2461 family)